MLAYVCWIDHLLRPGQAVLHLAHLLQSVERQLFERHSTQDQTHVERLVRPLSLPIMLLAFSKGALVLNTMLSELATIIEFPHFRPAVESSLTTADALGPPAALLVHRPSPVPAAIRMVNEDGSSSAPGMYGRSSPAPFVRIPTGQCKLSNEHGADGVREHGAGAGAVHHHSGLATHHHSARSIGGSLGSHQHQQPQQQAQQQASQQASQQHPLSASGVAMVPLLARSSDSAKEPRLLDWESDQIAAHIQFEPTMRISRSMPSRACITEFFAHRDLVAAFFDRVVEIHWLDCHRFPTDNTVVRALAEYASERVRHNDRLYFRLHTTPRQMRDRRCGWIALEHDYFIAYLKDGVRAMLSTISPRRIISPRFRACDPVPPILALEHAGEVESASASTSTSSSSSSSSSSEQSQVSPRTGGGSFNSGVVVRTPSGNEKPYVQYSEPVTRTCDSIVQSRMYLERDRPSLAMHFRVLDMFEPGPRMI